MTRTRARRLLRTAAAIWAAVAFAFAIDFYASGHPAAGSIAAAVFVAAALTAYLVGPHHGRAREQCVIHRQQSTDWRIETELSKFRAEISAWEAQQKAKP